MGGSRRADAPMYQVKKDTSDVWWGGDMAETGQYYYPPAEQGHGLRPMVKKTIVVEQTRPGQDMFMTREFALRLNKNFTKLEDLRNYIFEKYDPNRSGFISLGDFLCLWFKNHRFRHHRSYNEQMQVMGKAVRKGVVAGHAQQVAVTAVAAALAARTLHVEAEQAGVPAHGQVPGYPPAAAEQLAPGTHWWGTEEEVEGDRVYQPGKRVQANAGKWFGPHSLAEFVPRTEDDDQWVEMTPGMLYRLRAKFEKYNENDGSNPSDCSMHIRYGLVTSFLQDLKCDSTLGPFFAMTHLEMSAMLNDLVRHANESMANMREAKYEKHAPPVDDHHAPSGVHEDHTIDWDPEEDDELAMHLEEVRRCMKEKTRTGSEGKLRRALASFEKHKKSKRAPPYFEEPTYVFSCILALLLKHMVPLHATIDSPGRDEVLSFFNQGIKYFHSLLGAGGQGEDVPRILPVRVLIREFAILEVRRTGSTAFIDAHNPTFAGPREGKYKMAGLLPSRKVQGHGEIGAGGAM